MSTANVFPAGTAFRDQTFNDIDISAHAIDELEFDSCVFKDCNFSGAALKRWHLTDCRFEKCDLTAARLTGARLRGVSFINCRLGGINLACTTALDDISFHHCVLDSSVFSNLKLPRFSAVDCRVRDADFAEADLRGAIFTKCDLMGSRFFGADLSGADLRGAFDYLIDARQTKMKKTRVSLPEAVALLAGLDVVLEDAP